MKRALMLSTLLAASIAGVACAGGHVAYVRVAPPPPRIESYGFAPGPRYVRVDGYWRWGGSRYDWVPGYWARPPRARAAWIPGHWVSTPRGYYWRSGHWR